MKLTTLEKSIVEAKFANIFERLEKLEQKEPIDLTIDSEKLVKAINPDYLTDETNILKMENSELREECKFLHKMLIDERRFILETLKYDSIENYRALVHSNREHEKELQKATQE